MTKLNINKDIIRVWYCENCGYYTMDFNLERVYCRKCGYHMKARRYAEVIRK